MYVERRNVSTDYGLRKPGYVKSDFAMSQRLTNGATFLVNVVNLGNNFASDAGTLIPTLGRQTSFGLSLKFPKLR